MTNSQSERFFGPSSKGNGIGPDPRLPPDQYAATQGRVVERVSGNYFVEHTPPVVNPSPPELPPPGVQRVQSLVTQQGERALSDRGRAVEALVKATSERDRLAAAFARDQFREVRDALETSQRDVSLAQATLDAAEREWQRIKALQQKAAADGVFNALAQLDAAQADEAWGAEKDDLQKAVGAVAQQMAQLIKQQRGRAEELNRIRSDGRALARELELPWQPGRHDVHDRMLTIAAAFKKALIDAGVGAADLATFTRA